ncbi:MAG: Gfo/Idh/MocA family oxidoreductase [Chitinispirillaceae bacterium]|nr:Gfo/Idh/MocA family oxidoreductase [Chitinispirillaceae bacterium]
MSLKIGVIGYGYWGPNIVRNFMAANDAEVVAVSDKNTDVLMKVRKLYPSIKVASDANEVIDDPAIDAVAIVTPVSAHFDLAMHALEHDKHLFVEKPFTQTVDQAKIIIDLAARKQRTVMVDHTFLFTGAVRKAKELIDSRQMGDVYYYDSTRVNLGLFQHDVNVVWDLAPHDFSIMRYVLPEEPVAISATGKAHVGKFEDTAYITVHFQNNLVAHFNVNWLSPVKLRMTLIGGSKKMLVWNDVYPDEKVRIYDKGVDTTTTNAEGIYDLLVHYRTGDMWVPKLDQREALKLEVDHFIDCILTGKKPLSDGHLGLEVVKMLEACDRSMVSQGALVEL